MPTSNPCIKNRDSILNYRVDPALRVLTGGSLGGLFVLYAMFSDPGLFSAYLSDYPAVVARLEVVITFSREKQVIASRWSMSRRAGSRVRSSTVRCGVRDLPVAWKAHSIPRRTHCDPSRFQVLTGGFTADVGGLLDLP
jgi:hypothetical protein